MNYNLQTHCNVMNDRRAEWSIENDDHAPDKFRIIGTVSNSKYFAQDFKCTLNSKMNPEDKCEVW